MQLEINQLKNSHLRNILHTQHNTNASFPQKKRSILWLQLVPISTQMGFESLDH